MVSFRLPQSNFINLLITAGFYNHWETWLKKNNKQGTDKLDTLMDPEDR